MPGSGGTAVIWLYATKRGRRILTRGVKNVSPVNSAAAQQEL
jgi:hypothetical protein